MWLKADAYILYYINKKFQRIEDNKHYLLGWPLYGQLRTRYLLQILRFLEIGLRLCVCFFFVFFLNPDLSISKDKSIVFNQYINIITEIKRFVVPDLIYPNGLNRFFAMSYKRIRYEMTYKSSHYPIAYL
jgi:hypothetical protein